VDDSSPDPGASTRMESGAVGTVPPRAGAAPGRRRAPSRSGRSGRIGQSGQSGQSGRSGRGRPLAVAGLALAAVVLAAVTGWLALTVARDANAGQQRAAVLAAAQQEAVNLTTLDRQSASRDFAAVLAGAAGSLRQQLAAGRGAFLRTLSSADVTSAGTVLDAGIVSMNSRAAVVLLNVRAVVRTRLTRAPETRVYHWRAGLVYSGGRWLVTGLEFV
jgi:Mce-associated membrane protein